MRSQERWEIIVAPFFFVTKVARLPCRRGVRVPNRGCSRFLPTSVGAVLALGQKLVPGAFLGEHTPPAGPAASPLKNGTMSVDALTFCPPGSGAAGVLQRNRPPPPSLPELGSALRASGLDARPRGAVIRWPCAGLRAQIWSVCLPRRCSPATASSRRRASSWQPATLRSGIAARRASPVLAGVGRDAARSPALGHERAGC